VAKSFVPVFNGVVSADGSRLELDGIEAPMRRRYLRGLAGKRIGLVIREKRSQRSQSQNAWLWGVALPLLAEHLGYDDHEHETLHYAMLGECFGYTYDARTGHTVLAKTSSQLNTKEFAAYMEWLVRWAATEHGVIVPLPNESEAA
jgi:hypothetical protein